MGGAPDFLGCKEGLSGCSLAGREAGRPVRSCVCMASPCLFGACEITLKVVEAGKSPPPCTAGCLPAHVVRSPLYVLLPVCMQVYPHGYVL